MMMGWGARRFSQSWSGLHTSCTPVNLRGCRQVDEGDGMGASGGIDPLGARSGKHLLSALRQLGRVGIRPSTLQTPLLSMNDRLQHISEVLRTHRLRHEIVKAMLVSFSSSDIIA